MALVPEKPKKTLIVTFNTDNMDSETIEKFRAQLKSQLPNHDIAVIAVGQEDSVTVTELTQ